MGWDGMRLSVGYPETNVGVDQKVPLMKGDPKQSYIAKQQTDKRQHGNVGWNEMRTCGMGWDGMGWDGMGWDGTVWDTPQRTSTLTINMPPTNGEP